MPDDLKCLTIVDDATHEAVAIEVECAISGQMLTRMLDRLGGMTPSDYAKHSAEVRLR